MEKNTYKNKQKTKPQIDCVFCNFILWPSHHNI